MVSQPLESGPPKCKVGGGGGKVDRETLPSCGTPFLEGNQSGYITLAVSKAAKRGRIGVATSPLLSRACPKWPHSPCRCGAPKGAIGRSQRAPNIHVLVCICSNVRQFFHNGQCDTIALIHTFLSM